MKTMLVAGLAKLISGANARWIGCNPEPRQRVYFANHTSNLDGVVLWSVLPPPIRILTRPVAAHDYWTKNIIRQYLAVHVFNSILIERKRVTIHNNPIDLMLSEMDHRYSLIIFPEGGRNMGTEIGAFKSGIFHLAKKRPDIELIPVYIENLNRILPKGEFLPVPLLSSITFGSPTQVQESESKPDFLNRIRDLIIRLKTS